MTEEEQFVTKNRAAETAPEVIDSGPGLVIAGRRIRKEIRRIESRAVPEFV